MGTRHAHALLQCPPSTKQLHEMFGCPCSTYPRILKSGPHNNPGSPMLPESFIPVLRSPTFEQHGCKQPFSPNHPKNSCSQLPHFGVSAGERATFAATTRFAAFARASEAGAELRLTYWLATESVKVSSTTKTVVLRVPLYVRGQE